MMKQYLDISMPIHPDMTVYKNKIEKKPLFHVEDLLSLGKSYETTVTLNLHTGTHLDFPLHMIEGGATSTHFDPSTLIRDVRVIEIRNTDVIRADHLRDLNLQKGDFILFKTDNSFSESFDFTFTFVDESAAVYLSTIGIAGVGIDALGIERDQVGHPTHSRLMDASIWIMEGLRLKEVSPGTYKMIALPLSMVGCEALPLRVLLEVDA
jgi:arylformamidase